MSKTLQGNLRILAHNTRELRREIGETQEAVAEKAGISCRAYQSIEAGRGNPSLKTLDQLAFFYQVTLSRLFYLSRLRTDDLEKFSDKFKQKFMGYVQGACILNLDGQIIWGNPCTYKIIALECASGYHCTKFCDKKSYLVQPHSESPISMLNILTGTSREICKLQLEDLRRGSNRSIIMMIESSRGELQIVRTYPVSIFVKNQSYPVCAVCYLVPIVKDCDKSYFQFCDYLLDVVQIST